MTAGIIDFKVTAEVIVVRVIEEITAMFVRTPRLSMLFVLNLEADASFHFRCVNPHEFLAKPLPLASLILFVFLYQTQTSGPSSFANWDMFNFKLKK